ncbi:ATP-binding protein [Kitasatospora sp. NBC_00315]|uniref:ATP-binding protein n=1 Tax=Kitasatospora sp. NBC_00315 TaxID=2975963 RepID=UPI00324B37E7
MTGQVARGRDFTRRALADWGWLDEQDPHGQNAADDLLLMVSELLANACLHAGGPHELVLHASERLLRVEVLDGEPAVPVLTSPHDPGRPGGHGLHIIEKLSDSWGSTPGEHGKSVWLEFAAERFAAEVREPQDEDFDEDFDEDDFEDPAFEAEVLGSYTAYGIAPGGATDSDPVPGLHRHAEESPAP